MSQIDCPPPPLAPCSPPVLPACSTNRLRFADLFFSSLHFTPHSDALPRSAASDSTVCPARTFCLHSYACRRHFLLLRSLFPPPVSASLTPAKLPQHASLTLFTLSATRLLCGQSAQAALRMPLLTSFFFHASLFQAAAFDFSPLVHSLVASCAPTVALSSSHLWIASSLCSSPRTQTTISLQLHGFQFALPKLAGSSERGKFEKKKQMTQ